MSRLKWDLGARQAMAVLVIAGCLAGVSGTAMAQEDRAGDAPDAQSGTLGHSLQDAPYHEAVSLTCRFVRECYEDEPCQEGGYSASLSGRAGGLDAEALVVSVILSSESGDTDLVGVRDGGAMSLSGGPFEARHLLTVDAEGAARHTLHFLSGPAVVSYLGRCE